LRSTGCGDAVQKFRLRAVLRLEEMSILDDEWVVAFEREKAILWEAMNRHYMEHHTEEELAKAAVKRRLRTSQSSRLIC
jgi:hypothetical protein